MKTIFYLAFVSLFVGKFNRIAERNELLTSAADHYKTLNYSEGVIIYEKLIHQYDEQDELVKLNLAHGYFMLALYNGASDYYKELTKSVTPSVKSTAHLQLAVIAFRKNKKDAALYHLKESLKANPRNERARYNFELLKKDNHRSRSTSNTQKKESETGKNTTSATTVEEFKLSTGSSSNLLNPEKLEGGGENLDELEIELNNSGEKETDVLTANRLKEVSMSPQQARALLKTMQQEEVQYFQQQVKQNPKPIDPAKPSW